LENLSKNEQNAVLKIMQSLVDQPYQGKPLGVDFFREKKIGGRRVYYRIYKNYLIVLMLSISNKKKQQKTIDTIRLKKDELLAYVRELSKMS
jgi:mRNA-degrading endonuclease RelE of RelBE toxin-antitoxin system